LLLALPALTDPTGCITVAFVKIQDFSHIAIRCIYASSATATDFTYSHRAYVVPVVPTVAALVITAKDAG